MSSAPNRDAEALMNSATTAAQLRLDRVTPSHCRAVLDNPPLNLMGPEFVSADPRDRHGARERRPSEGGGLRKCRRRLLSESLRLPLQVRGSDKHPAWSSPEIPAGPLTSCNASRITGGKATYSTRRRHGCWMRHLGSCICSTVPGPGVRGSPAAPPKVSPAPWPSTTARRHPRQGGRTRLH